MAVVDVNGDGLDDVVIGAPLHTDFTGDKYETGRVYVVYQNAQVSLYYYFAISLNLNFFVPIESV